MSALKYDLFVI